ncbi:hypothetical protein ACQUWN_04320 [Rossellomorea aquimaris]|uniref:hypothetical protein n=1 Tax=Bacillaceae TaxID=186817 RepID=UPI0013B06BDA|nr:MULTISPECIES: hypothetical protein [Bacillaceae]
MTLNLRKLLIRWELVIKWYPSARPTDKGMPDKEEVRGGSIVSWKRILEVNK